MIGVLTSVRYYIYIYISEPERAIIAKYCLRLQGICFSVISFQSSDPWFYSWAKPDSYWSAQDRLNDGWVKLFQQLLWQVKLPQLVNEGQPFVGLFFFTIDVSVPIQVLRDDGSQELICLHCSHSTVYDVEWGECRGVERVELQVV